MKGKIRLCINSQTPLVRFKMSYAQLHDKYGVDPSLLKFGRLKEGEDYDYSPGGVTAMIYPAVKRMIKSGYIERPNWISLGPGAPEKVALRDTTIYNVSLDQKQLSLYTNFKESIWNEIHGTEKREFYPGEYEAYAQYNWLCAKLMLEMLDKVDIFWIHDFQQLLTGNLIGPSAPAVFRWHIPFRLDGVSDRMRVMILKSIEGFDAMVVSTKRDLEGLIHAGYRGKAYAINPYLDTSVWNRVSNSEVEATRAKFGLKTSDRIALIVARMDPVKNQDVAIRAFASIAREHRDAKLVLAGNGSFTGSYRGGLGHPKASKWRIGLEKLAKKLKVDDRIIFTGHLTHEEVDALYSTCDVTIVPSNIEGFNLTAVESWIHRRPCIVSRGAGVSELVHDGVDGLTFEPSDEAELAEKLSSMLRSSDAATRMGENGASMAKLCDVENALKSIEQVFDEASKMYSDPRQN
ncbi:MAG: glycosyltransferase family 4 protein [Nitrososphaerota archaeon]|nr:glycosyltransferase family 4 protein [Nitrososphaerota archaeon]